jgi:NADH-quinone oxidoreductase subunit G
LSVLAPAIAELAAKPYLALNPEDAAELCVAAGDSALLQLSRNGSVDHEMDYELPVQLRAELRRGVAGLPAGLPGLTGIMLPAWGRVARAQKSTKIGEGAAP